VCHSIANAPAFRLGDDRVSCDTCSPARLPHYGATLRDERAIAPLAPHPAQA